ncbi:retrovirus-related Pol polyprotein from transposon opus [Trichonephila clavipes]|nr:retrovirus-related Pol polyprotein from transposon opus [Trichonephila clavipes]
MRSPATCCENERAVNGQLQDDFLQSLWLQRMPPHIQTVLSTSSEPLDKLAIIADKPTMDSLARQIQELSLQVAELTRERNSLSTNDIVLTAGDHIHALGVSIKEVASATIIAVIKSRPASVFHLVHLCKKKRVSSVIAGMAEPSKHTSRLFLLDRKPQQPFFNFQISITWHSPPYYYYWTTSHCRPRRLHPKLYDAVKVEFEFLLAQGIIRPSKSPWSSPLHVVPKSDSTVRPVGDYRQLNSVTEFDSYPMPYLNDFAHALHGKKIFSKIDIFKAFHQIPIAECDIPKTAVTTPWENAEEHRSHLRTIFQRLSSYGLKLNISKCVFGVTELIFLGHFITPDGIKPLPDKVQAVLDYKQPETVGSLRKFLGLLNFYRRFLPKAAEQQYLLSEFLKGSKGKKDSKPLNWSSEAITAFQRCKQALADAALFAHPSPSAPLALHVDASDYAIGGALHQVVDSELQPLAFFSRKLTSSEKSYSAYDREHLAIYSAIRHFSVYAGS